MAEAQAQAPSLNSSALVDFSRVRLTFLQDYVYVLRKTVPGLDIPKEKLALPSGFYTRPLAVEMLKVGRQWEWSHRFVGMLTSEASTNVSMMKANNKVLASIKKERERERETDAAIKHHRVSPAM